MTKELEESPGEITKLLPYDRKYLIYEWDDNIEKEEFINISPESNSESSLRTDYNLRHETTSKYRPLLVNWNDHSPQKSQISTKMNDINKNLTENILYYKRKFVRLYQETVMKIPVELEIRATGNEFNQLFSERNLGFDRREKIA